MSYTAIHLVKLRYISRQLPDFLYRQILLPTQDVSLRPPQTWNAFKHYSTKYSSLKSELNDIEVKRGIPYSRLRLGEKQGESFPTVVKNCPPSDVVLHTIKARVRSTLRVPHMYTVSVTEPSSQLFVCELRLTWPEKRDFTGQGSRKVIAKREAARQAVQWLFSQGFITQDAKPIFRATAFTKNINDVNFEEHTLKNIDDVLKIYRKSILPVLSSHVEDMSPSNGDQICEKLHPLLGKPFPNSEDLENWSKVLKSRRRNSVNKKALPIDSHRKKILDCIQNSRVTIVKGETGCGKTVRVPQFILDDAIMEGQGAHCNIVVVQPRRLTTMETAKYVASERGERIGLSIGYSVRMSSSLPSVIGGSITFMTSMRLAVKFSSDSLHGVSHVVLDEVHLRDGGTDLVMTLLKQAMKVHKKLKVILMSATMDTTVFQSYFNCFGKVPVVVVPGRTFPVKMHFLENLPPKIVHSSVEKSEDKTVQINFSLVQRVVSWINQTKPAGAVLVFISGLSDISTLQKALATEKGLFVVPVHSIHRDCSAAFEPAPSNQRKVILATNVAETSITFPDVVYVVDCGIHKKPYRKVSSQGGWTLPTMSLEWITKANVLQRRGRAGRVQRGESFHLFSEDVFKGMEDYDQPGVMTDSLEYLILSIKMVNPNIKSVDLLKEFPTPPSETDVRQAVHTLQAASLLSRQDEIPTSLATAAMSLSCSLPAAVALINSAIFRCLDQTLSVVASEDTPLVMNKTAVCEKTLKCSYHQSSDHLAKGMIVCDTSMASIISHPSYHKTKAVKAFLEKQIRSRLFPKNDNLDEHSCEEMVLALLMKSFGFLMAASHSLSLEIYLRDKSGMTSFIDSRSVNHNLKQIESPFLMYLSGRIARGTLSVSDTSLVSPQSVLLFLPSALHQDKSFEPETKVFKVCGNSSVRISISNQDYQRIESLRQSLEDIQEYFVKAEFLNQPDNNYDLMVEFRRHVLNCVTGILQDC